MPRPRLRLPGGVLRRVLPSRRVAIRGLLALAALLLVVGLVPPLRDAAALGASKVVLFVASPLAPGIDDFEDLPETSRIVATDGSVLAELDRAQRRVPIELDALPDHVSRAVLAAEDESFYEHGGVDPTAVFRAFLRTATGDTQGGSTITQQLAKINYTAGERTIFRKLREVLYTTRLEKRYSKDVLLERYLNQVYFGDGSYGIEAAAQSYFGVKAAELTPAQAAMLAGKISAPERIDPRKRLEAATARRNRVLGNMREEGWLAAAAHDEAVREPVELAPPRPPADEAVVAPHFVEFVKREAKTVEALGGSPETRSNRLFTRGYTVETTLDRKVYDATVAAVRERLGEADDPVTAAATVAPGDGAIRSLFGGLDFATTQFDMSSLGRRQAGSAFKPFVYLGGLRDGIDPRTTYDGTSGRTIPCYGRPVQNYAGEDAGGRITVDEAMVKSVNVVFVDLGCQVGVRDVLRAATDAGIPEDADSGQGAAFLGGLTKGVNALQMANAFATFAAEGVEATPYAIARIKDAKGRVVYERDVETRQAFRREEVGVLNVPLQAVVERGTGVAARIGRPVAGKTGTTQDNVDAWFAGYTPQLATSVWVGFPDEVRTMENVNGVRSVTGGTFPAAIFSAVMTTAHEGLPVRRLPTATPDQLDLRRTDATTTSSSSSTSSSSTTSSSLPPGVTTTTSPTATTRPVAGGSTTTTRPPSSTTTTTTRRRPNATTTTTTTTAPPATTTTVASSAGSDGGAPPTTT